MKKNIFGKVSFFSINIIIIFLAILMLTSCTKENDSKGLRNDSANITNENILPDKNTIIENITEPKEVECFDSDNGTAYYTAGYVVDKEGNHPDICINYRMVIEQICKNNTAYNFTYRCPKSCSNGKCI